MRLINPERWPTQPEPGMHEAARCKEIRGVDSFFLSGTWMPSKWVKLSKNHNTNISCLSSYSKGDRMCVITYVWLHDYMCKIIPPTSRGNFSFPGFEEKQQDLKEGTCGMEPRATCNQQPERNWGPRSTNQQDLNASNKHMSLEAEPSPGKPRPRLQLQPARRLQVCKAWKQRAWLNLTHGLLMHGNREMRNVCYFKPLNFLVILFYSNRKKILLIERDGSHKSELEMCRS